MKGQTTDFVFFPIHLLSFVVDGTADYGRGRSHHPSVTRQGGDSADLGGRVGEW